MYLYRYEYTHSRGHNGMSEVLDSIHHVHSADKERMQEQVVCDSGATVWSACRHKLASLCVCIVTTVYVCARLVCA